MATGSPPAETPEPRRRVRVTLLVLGAVLVAAGGAWFLSREPDGTSYRDTNALVAAMEDAGVVCHWKPIGDKREDAIGNLDPEDSMCWVGDSEHPIGIEAQVDRSEIEAEIRVTGADGSPLGNLTLLAGPDWVLRIPKPAMAEGDARRLGDALGATHVVPIQAMESEG